MPQDPEGSLKWVGDYYPFGLTMAGISSKALGGMENKRKFNDGTELESKEFSDGSGLELYSTNYRMLDPQIGRFWHIDPLADVLPDFSPYVYGNNNPIVFNDPLGLMADSTGKPSLSDEPTGKMAQPKVLEEVIVTGKPGRPEKPLTATEKFTSIEGYVPLLGEYRDFKHVNYSGSFYEYLTVLAERSKIRNPNPVVHAGTPPTPGFTKLNPKDLAKIIKMIRNVVRKGNGANGIKRIDVPKLDANGNPIFGQQPHIHLEDGRALNMDGTWKHGSGDIPSKVIKWLDEAIKNL